MHYAEPKSLGSVFVNNNFYISFATKMLYMGYYFMKAVKKYVTT